MNFPDHLLPEGLLWASDVLGLLLLTLATLTASWRRLVQNDLLNVWFGLCVGLMLLWSIKTGIRPGLNFHLLGAMLFTLMFGVRLALVGFFMVLLGVTLAGSAGWSSLGANWLVSALLPVTLSALIFHLIDRKLPNHLFVYIFLNAFFGAGLVVVITGLLTTLLLVLTEVYSSGYLAHNYLPYYLLMGWSEALLTGMAVTLMTAFRPQWLSSFSDVRYLKTNNSQ